MQQIRLPLVLFICLLLGFGCYKWLFEPQLTRDDHAILLEAQNIGNALVEHRQQYTTRLLGEIKAEIERRGNPGEADAQYQKLEKLHDLALTNLTELKIFARDLTEYQALSKATVRVESNKLYDRLTRYSQKLESDFGHKIPPLTRDPNQKALSQDEFLSYYIEAPLPVVNYTLLRLKSEILQGTQQVLQQWHNKFLKDKLQYRHLMPLVSAEADIVDPGKPYRAWIEVRPVATIPAMQMSSSEGEVSVKDGIGQVRILAKADKFDERGLAKKTWTGYIRAHLGTWTQGRDTVFSSSMTYFVRKKNPQP